MLSTLRTSWSIQATYHVNSILYSLKQVPGLKRLLPERLYQVKSLKIFALLLSLIWGILRLFVGKSLYFLVFLSWPLRFYSDLSTEPLYLYQLLMLTVIGAFLNIGFIEPSYQRYYAVSLLRMNAKNYTLTQFGWEMTKTLVGFLPFSLLFGGENGVSLWFCLLFPFCVVGGKLFMAARSLRRFERRGGVVKETSWLQWGGAVALLFLAYALPLTGFIPPVWMSTMLLLFMIPQGLISLPILHHFQAYRQLNQQILANFFSDTEAASNSVKTNTHNMITENSTVTSNKKGFEYLNELFIKRHQKLLWQATRKISIVCTALVAVGVVLLKIFPDVEPVVRETILHSLPVWAFILYFLSRGMGFTKALFINCDHSLLTYSFYKQPRCILKLFRIRLWEICKINVFPALILGFGLDVLLLVSGGTGVWIEYLVVPVTLISMSLFFAIHYLTLYYLLQPYNAGTEIKSGTYQIITGVTYLACYQLTKLQLSVLLFGVLCISFCVAYGVIACILVYRVAPQTFRIR